MEKISTIENVANQIIPYIIRFTITIGIAIILVETTIMLYCLLKGNNKLKRTKKDFINFISAGILTVLSGLLINFLSHYKLDFSSYKHSIPSVYTIVLIITFCSLKNGNTNKKNR